MNDLDPSHCLTEGLLINTIGNQTKLVNDIQVHHQSLLVPQNIVDINPQPIISMLQYLNFINMILIYMFLFRIELQVT